MPLFRNSSGSSDTNSSSTTNSSTWNSSQIEDFLTNQYDPSLFYENINPVNMSPAMQAVLGYETSGKGIQTGKSVIGKGLGIAGTALDDFQNIKGVSGQDIMDSWMGATKQIYGNASDFISAQDQAIENSVLVNYGDNAANFNTQQMNGNNGSFTSAQAYGNTAMAVDAANSMASQESKVANSVLAASASVAGSGVRSMAKKNVAQMGLEGNVATGLISTGANMANKSVHNMWNAGLVETGYQGYVDKTNRHNDMINGNIGLADDMLWLQTMLQAGNVETNSTTSSNSHSSW